MRFFPFLRHPFKFLKRGLPQSFLGRSFLIILAPVVMIQIFSGYVFFDRHWEYVTRILAQDIAGEISVVTHLIEKDIPFEPLSTIQKIAAQKLMLVVLPSSVSWEKLPESRGPFQSFLKIALKEKLVQHPFKMYLDEDWIHVWVKTHHGIFLMKTYKKRLFSRTTPLFLMWSLGSSVVFVILAMLFMKNQISPLRRLALFADQLGRGKVQEKYKNQGAIEIRKLAWTFHMMSMRLQKQLQERTEMLAGISHDLRTPLTRMKLQLALMPPSPDLIDLQKDVDHMVQMVESYLHFSKGEGAELSESLRLAPLVSHVIELLTPTPSIQIQTHIPSKLKLVAQPRALERCFINLLENATRYANSQVHITAKQSFESVLILIDDDGPGISEENYENVFKPFFRVDASRNAQTGGMGLGLNIVHTLMKAHKGSINLGVSPQGGLRIKLKFNASEKTNLNIS